MKRLLPLLILVAAAFVAFSCGTRDASPAPKMGSFPILRWGGDLDGSTMSSQVVPAMHELAEQIGGGRAPIIDYDSIITGDLTQQEWAKTNDGAPTVSAFNSSDGTFSDLVQLNANGNATGNGGLIQPFSVPSGVTSATFSVTCSEASSKQTLLRIYDASLASFEAQAFCNNTTSLTTCSVTATTLSTATLYYAALEVNNAASQAKPVCGRASLTIGTGGSGVFAGNFIRIKASADMFAGNYGPDFAFGTSYPYTNPWSELTITTNAARVAAEIAVDTGGNAQVAWLIGGRVYEQSGALGLGSTFTFHDIAIPTSVSALAGPQRVTVRQDTGYNGNGNYVTALFVPVPVSYLRLDPPRKSTRVALDYGDSITGGLGPTNYLVQGWPSYFRARFPGEVFLEQYAGRQFFTDTNNGTTANEQAFAKTLAKSRATDVLIAIGTNDYSDANWNATNFGLSYARVLDDIHAVLPFADVWCISPIPRATETANALGSTLGNYRTQINTACTAGSRSPWAHFIDGTGPLFPTTSDLVDGIHPNAEGHAKYARGVLSAMGLNISGGRPASLAGLMLAGALVLARRRRPANDAAERRDHAA